MKRLVLGVALGFAGALLLLAPVRAARDPAYDQLDRFSDAFERIWANYVHPVDNVAVIDAAIKGMASSLDPHSSFMNEKEYLAAQSFTAGTDAGVGLELTQVAGFPAVLAPIDGGPAATSGIKAGDFIDAIDGQLMFDRPLADVTYLLRGPVGSKIAMTVRRPGAPSPLQFTLTRVIINVKSVRHERKGNVGYIRVASLVNDTDASLKEAVAGLKAEIGPRLKGYVLDLRNCPGGLLDVAVRLSDDFLDGGEILSTRGRRPENNQEYKAQPGDEMQGKPIVVLINGSTGAGAEFVAAALQDNHRARIVGTHSFGEGTIQTIIPIGKDGGALRLTTATVLSPSGREIQETGVTPDVTVIQSAGAAVADSDLGNVREQLLRGHLQGGSPAAPSNAPVVRPDPKKSYGDFQLSYAIQTLGG